jgi:hypothetical protein
MTTTFPAQHLEPHHQVSFAPAFGPLTTAHPVVPAPIAEHPEILVLDSEKTRAAKETP